MVGGSEELGCAVEAEVVGAGEDQHVFGLQLTDGALLGIFLVHSLYLNNWLNVIKVKEQFFKRPWFKHLLKIVQVDILPKTEERGIATLEDEKEKDNRRSCFENKKLYRRVGK